MVFTIIIYMKIGYTLENDANTLAVQHYKSFSKFIPTTLAIFFFHSCKQSPTLPLKFTMKMRKYPGILRIGDTSPDSVHFTSNPQSGLQVHGESKLEFGVFFLQMHLSYANLCSCRPLTEINSRLQSVECE